MCARIEAFLGCTVMLVGDALIIWGGANAIIRSFLTELSTTSLLAPLAVLFFELRWVALGLLVVTVPVILGKPPKKEKKTMG